MSEGIETMHEAEMPLDRRKPSTVKLALTVSLLTTVIVGAGTFMVTRLATDYADRRDTMLYSHETRLQSLEQDRAVTSSRLQNIERTQEKILANQEKLFEILGRK